MAALSLTPLGTNGFVPTFGRQTMSHLVRHGARALLLDAGSGVARLLEPAGRQRLAGAESLEILLTHYHLDHVVGLSYLPAIWRQGRIRLWAPAPPLVDAAPEEALERLLSPPLFPLRCGEFPAPLEIVPYGGDSLEVAGLPARLRRQRHGGGSVGVVLGERLAYCTDCEPEAATSRFAAGVELLLHEVWVSDAEVAAGAHRQGHSTVEEVAAIARQAQAGALMPVHHFPPRDADGLAELARRLGELSGIEVLLPEEGREYRLG
ncbi:MAG TPA: MBL fold metallo-hydrolase [Thermoanaerobaculia bacterium]|nr:MBL fold metallo-hydrolase [Thermoanaerobaculia bacterium]